MKIAEVAELLGLPKIVETLKPCPKGHTQKYSRTGKCVGCTAEINLRWRVERSDDVRRASRESYYKYCERRKARARNWKKNNREILRLYQKEWVARNPEKVAAQSNKRRAAFLKAIPEWADLKQIEAIYRERARITKETGIMHHVDHIVPLVSPIVCGLHVQSNLRIITESENARKGNRLDEELAIAALYPNVELREHVK